MDVPDFWKPEIYTFLNRILNRNDFLNPQSSGGPTSIVFLIELLIEMSSGASRALDVRNRAVEPLELWTSEINAFLNRILNGNELWGFQTSGGLKLMLFLMDFVIEMCH